MDWLKNGVRSWAVKRKIKVSHSSIRSREQLRKLWYWNRSFEACFRK